MNVKHAIVHRIDKDQKARVTHVELRPKELKITPNVVKLIGRVVDLYTKRTSQATGRFESHGVVGKEFQALQSKTTNFAAMSHTAMNVLKSAIDPVTLATGGHMLFAHYESRNQEFQLIVMLKQTEGVSFNDALEVQNVDHIDLSSLHLAARVNLSMWRASLTGTERYVSFIKGKNNQDVRNYFRTFLAITEFLDNAVQTDELVAAIRNYCKDRGLSIDETHAAQQAVLDYGQERLEANKPFQLEEVSPLVNYEEPTDFLEFVNDNEIPLSGEFQLDSRRLRKLRRYSGRDSDVAISFDAEVFGRDKRVDYVESTDTLKISPTPAGLREWLRSNSQED